ncbi:hypothetical protein [Deinococcus fonticola]|uniref:hypothetical protein n=1 Tax=Deinococcus fonticola TaxID=2528713 RepID=UPI001F0EFCCC|nr:hypothetical protein [Deinococcus fonticola]
MQASTLALNFCILPIRVVAVYVGLPFSQAGDDLLRSKSCNTDSDNGGDWFNTVDWTGQSNGLGR